MTVNARPRRAQQTSSIGSGRSRSFCRVMTGDAGTGDGAVPARIFCPEPLRPGFGKAVTTMVARLPVTAHRRSVVTDMPVRHRFHTRRVAGTDQVSTGVRSGSGMRAVENSLKKFPVVMPAISPRLSARNAASRPATSRTKAGSFVFPRNGTGAR